MLVAISKPYQVCDTLLIFKLKYLLLLLPYQRFCFGIYCIHIVQF